MSRVTLETVGGNRLDIVNGFEEAVSNYYVLRVDLPRLIDRAKELGVFEGVPPEVFRVLLSENLIRQNQRGSRRLL